VTALLTLIGALAFGCGMLIGARYPRQAYRPTDEVRSYWSRNTLETSAAGVVATILLMSAVIYCFNRDRVALHFSGRPAMSGTFAGVVVTIVAVGVSGFSGVLLSSWIRGRRNDGAKDGS
jgi:hypothetical protein